MRKRVLASLLSLSLVLSLFTGTAGAASVSDREKNDSIGTAQAVSLGDTINGSISVSGDTDFYQFTLTSSGKVTLDITAYMQYYSLLIFDKSGTRLWYTEQNGWNSAVGFRNDTHNVFLEVGTYYLQVKGSVWNDGNSSYTGTYKIDTTFTSANATEQEPNNSVAQATGTSLGNPIRGVISVNGDYDFYCFTLTESGKVTLDITAYMKYYSLLIFDESGTRLWYTEQNGWNSAVGFRNDTYNVFLEVGTYYLQVKGSVWNDGNSSYTGTYKIDTTFTSANATEREPNNSVAQATGTYLGNTIRGVISENGDYDFYGFTLTESSKVTLGITAYMKYYSLLIFDESGTRLWYTEQNGWNSAVGYSEKQHEVELSSGAYYLQVKGSAWNDGRSDYTGTYTITLGTGGGASTIPVTDLTLNKSSLTLAVGEKETLRATVSPEDASDTGVTWSSSNTKVATVSGGKVTAVGAGSAVITANAKGGDCSAICAVTVTDDSVAVTGVRLDMTSLSLEKGKTATLRATVLPSDADNTGVTWSSSNTKVATVSGGKVTAKGTGTAVITVKTKDGGYTSTCAVTVIEKGAPSTNTFYDVASTDYWYLAVQWAVGQGITTGTSGTTFSPNETCSRAQVVTFLWRAAGSPTPSSKKNPFNDVSSGTYYYNAVLWAVEEGITSGTGAKTFGPEETVTRAQTVTFLWRAAGSPSATGSAFRDVPSNTYYSTAVKWAVKNGVTTGTTPTTFGPEEGCARGQIVTFLYRASGV